MPAEMIATMHGSHTDHTAPDRPRLAVLPFANLGGDPQQAHFVDGLMEEVVTCLTRIRTLFVISSGSTLNLREHNLTSAEAAKKLGVRYVVEGSVRHSGERLRVAVKLVDASTGAQVWTDRFDGMREDVFDLQDQIALGVAGQIEFSLQNAETVRKVKRPTHDLHSYDLYLRACTIYRRYSREAVIEAVGLVEQAIERDGDFALALSLAAAGHGLIAKFHWDDDRESHLHAARSLTRRAIRFGDDDPQVLATCALSEWNHGAVAEAVRLSNRACTLNPGSSFALMVHALVSVATGDLADAEHCIGHSLQLDPHSPNRTIQLQVLGAIRLAQGRHEEALQAGQEATHLSASPVVLAQTAAAAGFLGKARLAAETLKHFHEVADISPADACAMVYQLEELRAVFREGVSKAEELAAQT
jgi:TolB-like protein